VRLIPTFLYDVLVAIADTMTKLLVRIGLSADVITLLGFLFGAAAAALFVLGLPFWALVAGVASALFDGVDGRVAAATNRKTRFGAMLDSTLDRYVDFFIFGALMYHFRGRWPVLLAFAALVGAVMVSYTRARAEGLGIDCRGGIMQRPERLILFGLAMVGGLVFRDLDTAWIIVLAVIALGSQITALQRLFLVRRRDREATEAGTEVPS